MNKTTSNIEFEDLLGRWMGLNGNEVSYLNITKIFEDRGKEFNFRFSYRTNSDELDFAALVHFERNTDPILVIDDIYWGKGSVIAIDYLQIWSFANNTMTLEFPNGQKFELIKHSK